LPGAATYTAAAIAAALTTFHADLQGRNRAFGCGMGGQASPDRQMGNGAIITAWERHPALPFPF